MHGLHEHLIALDDRRSNEFPIGGKNIDPQRGDDVCLREAACVAFLTQDGGLQDDDGVAELAGWNRREG